MFDHRLVTVFVWPQPVESICLTPACVDGVCLIPDFWQCLTPACVDSVCLIPDCWQCLIPNCVANVLLTPGGGDWREVGTVPVKHSQGLPGSSVCHHWWDCGTGRPEGSHWQVPAFGPVGKHTTLYSDLYTFVTFLLLDRWVSTLHSTGIWTLLLRSCFWTGG